ncbi:MULTISPECIES: energy-coupling factor ABC transporter ATP-binding protein [Clostridia]|uniref:ABC transporter ATP-binding protein n=1 Tax=Faecalicatena fissicatena TaxID=290055 RepID=A0ABS2E913_9FIRM|nr:MULTISPECIES: ABC transporter ATP-binding protein [Clostridia]MBM6738144.1 ABC transporter ATP-binding protein [Faecalicatena fissicatena]OUQ51137.1 cobalt ABC transporter ATP-binding protein [Lachnoclostridium sp. An118]HIX99040.1 energy-coupling factor ABC transporter ATP-binding protein [Candidatus Dorea intestinigallinarum]
MNDLILEARHVSYSYGSGETPSLKDLSLSIRRGRRTAVMGANGSGKSTFFLCCNGILRPDEGQIYYNGQPLSYRKKDLLSLREKVGIVFQDPDMQLFCASVYQEISFGPLNLGLPREEAAREVEAVIRRLGITPFRHRPAHALSGGQKKQVALADILVMHPELLILDEPFAALDPSHVHIIRDMIRDLEKDSSPSGPLTVVIATHDTDFALEWADEVILFSEGQVLAQGAPASVLTDRELLARASLDLPGVIKVFESLQAAGLLGADLPAPKHLDQLTDYIRHTV